MSVFVKNKSFKGLSGAIDCLMDWPDTPPKGWALVLHPHPLHGGARDNKVVTTLARACVEHGLVAVRPNFRGVGLSAGQFDGSIGETADMHALVEQFTQEYPDLAAAEWVLAGFSFGTSVAARLYSEWVARSQRTPALLILAGTAVQRFAPDSTTVPDDTLLVHGELDDVVPLSEVMNFARTRDLPVVVVPGAGHFFHGKLIVLRQLARQRLAAL